MSTFDRLLDSYIYLSFFSFFQCVGFALYNKIKVPQMPNIVFGSNCINILKTLYHYPTAFVQHKTSAPIVMACGTL